MSEPDYSRLIAVTERALCPAGLMNQLARVCALRPESVILREKDLPEAAYVDLAEEAAALCRSFSVPLFVHSRPELARALSCGVHFSLPGLRAAADTLSGLAVSVSCHCLADVLEAEQLGAARAILGNIYETDCKPGLPGRGLSLLRECAAAVRIPVWAIGGVTPERLPEILGSGAAGGCMRSWFMKV